MGTHWQNGQYTRKKISQNAEDKKKILSKIRPVSFLESLIIQSQCSHVFKDRNQEQFSNMYIPVPQGRETR